MPAALANALSTAAQTELNELPLVPETDLESFSK